MEAKLRKVLQSPQAYRGAKEFRLQIIQGDQEAQTGVINVIGMVLKDPKAQPIEKLLAVKLAKDSIETFNDKFIGLCQRGVLSAIEQIALFNIDDLSPEKGKHYFSQRPTADEATTGISILQLAQECIWVWSKWFPVDPNTQLLSCYKICFLKLVRLGVKFPPLSYFRVSQVKKQLPDMTTPIKMLKEANKIIEEQLLTGQQVPNQKICDRLKIALKSIVNSGFKKKDDYYNDILRRCVKKLKKEKGGQGTSANSVYGSSSSNLPQGQDELQYLRQENARLRRIIEEQARELSLYRPSYVAATPTKSFTQSSVIQSTNLNNKNLIRFSPLSVSITNQNSDQAPLRISSMNSSKPPVNRTGMIKQSNFEAILGGGYPTPKRPSRSSSLYS